jgi:hypothetical protein
LEIDVPDLELSPFELIRTKDNIIVVVDPDPELALPYLVRNVAERLRIEQKFKPKTTDNPELERLIGAKALGDRAVFELTSASLLPDDYSLGGAIKAEVSLLPELEGEMLPVGLIDTTKQPHVRARLVCQPPYQTSGNAGRPMFVEQVVDSPGADLS